MIANTRPIRPQPLSYIAVLFIAVSLLAGSLVFFVRNQVSLEATAQDQARQALNVAVASRDLSEGRQSAIQTLRSASSESRTCVLNSIRGRFVPGGEITVAVICASNSTNATASATGSVGRFRSVGG